MRVTGLVIVAALMSGADQAMSSHSGCRYVRSALGAAVAGRAAEVIAARDALAEKSAAGAAVERAGPADQRHQAREQEQDAEEPRRRADGVAGDAHLAV